MRSAKRNKIRKVGHGRGVPIRLLAAIARKYRLSHFVAWTRDKQERERVLYWAKDDLSAMQCADFCQAVEVTRGWTNIHDFDCSSVRRLKDRIKELETGFARVFERDGEPREIARVMLKLPADIDTD